MFDWIGDNAAVLIALFAFFVACYQAYSTRRHNRLSVRPHLALFPDRHHSPGSGRIAVKLRNNGLGPAVIDEFRVTLDGGPIPTQDAAAAGAKLSSLLGRPISHFHYDTLAAGQAFAKDQEMTLLEVIFEVTSAEEFETVARRIDRFTLLIKYKSMYGEPFVYRSKDQQ